VELELRRIYYPGGTNGEIWYDGKRICFSIELPWRQNRTGISCIPEGRYALVKRYSRRYRWHLHLKDVPARQWILIHAANDAEKELRGCIAPVSILTAEGRGLRSRAALKRLRDLVFEGLEDGEVFLRIVRD
jgi:hypothetical protein